MVGTLILARDNILEHACVYVLIWIDAYDYIHI